MKTWKGIPSLEIRKTIQNEMEILSINQGEENDMCGIM